MTDTTDKANKSIDIQDSDDMINTTNILIMIEDIMTSQVFLDILPSILDYLSNEDLTNMYAVNKVYNVIISKQYNKIKDVLINFMDMLGACIYKTNDQASKLDTGLWCRCITTENTRALNTLSIHNIKSIWFRIYVSRRIATDNMLTKTCGRCHEELIITNSLSFFCEKCRCFNAASYIGADRDNNIVFYKTYD